MARNLLAEAQITAAAEVAPQVAALSEALQQARSDRNSAIRAAATAYHGLSGAIHRAGPQVKGIYRGAAQGAAGTDAIAGQTLGGLASSPGVDTIKAAYAHEGAVGGAVLAKSLASRLASLSDKRIAAAAGRAYSVNKASSDYSAAAATNASKRSALAQQQGLLTGAAYSKLTEAAAGRKNQRILQSQRLDSQASLQSERLASQETVAGARLRSSEHTAALGRRQQKLGRINQGKLQSQRLAASAKPKAGAPFKPTKDQIAQTNVYFSTLKAYQDDGAKKISMRHTAADADKHGVPRPITNAAADYYTRGHITPKSAQELRAIGVVVPDSHIGIPVKAHTRKRRH